MNTRSRATTAARRTSQAQGAIIAAETTAPRTAPHLGDEEGNLAKAGIFARNQEGKCSPTSRDVLVVLFSLHRALGRGREKIAEGAGQCFCQMDEFAVSDPSCSTFNFRYGIAPDIPTDALALGR